MQRSENHTDKLRGQNPADVERPHFIDGKSRISARKGAISQSFSFWCCVVYLWADQHFLIGGRLKGVAEGFSPLTTSRRSLVRRADRTGCGDARRATPLAPIGRLDTVLNLLLWQRRFLNPFFDVVNLLIHSTDCARQQLKDAEACRI